MCFVFFLFLFNFKSTEEVKEKRETIMHAKLPIVGASRCRTSIITGLPECDTCEMVIYCEQQNNSHVIVHLETFA